MYQWLPFHVRRRSVGLWVLAVGFLFGAALLPKVAVSWLYQSMSLLGTLLRAGLRTLVYGGVAGDGLAGSAFVGNYLKRALEEVEADREFTDAEREAFRAFGEKIRSLSPQSAPSGPAIAADSGTPPTVAQTAATPDTQDGLETVRRRYEETVLAVPGTEDVYGESLSEHLSAEFGADLGAVVLEGDTLTPTVQSLLVSQATAAARERQQYLGVLDAEYDAVLDANERLQPTEAVLDEIDTSRLYRYSFEELFEYEGELRSASETCRGLLEDRQREIHDTPGHSGPRSDSTTLQEHLYRSLETSFPVLSTALEQLRTLSDRRRAVIRSIARRL
jgi:hypothetical protein